MKYYNNGQFKNMLTKKIKKKRRTNEKKNIIVFYH